MKERPIYEEKYKEAYLKPHALPDLKHTNGAEVLSAQILESGMYQDGREYQIIKVVLRPKAERPL